MVRKTTRASGRSRNTEKYMVYYTKPLTPRRVTRGVKYDRLAEYEAELAAHKDMLRLFSRQWEVTGNPYYLDKCMTEKQKISMLKDTIRFMATDEYKKKELEKKRQNRIWDAERRIQMPLK